MSLGLTKIAPAPRYHCDGFLFHRDFVIRRAQPQNRELLSVELSLKIVNLWKKFAAAIAIFLLPCRKESSKI